MTASIRQVASFNQSAITQLTSNVAFATATLAGSTIVVFTTNDVGFTINTVSDPVNGNYTPLDVIKLTGGISQNTNSWILENAQVFTQNVTVTLNQAGDFNGITIVEVIGVASNSLLANSMQVQNVTGSSALSSGSKALGSNPAIVIGFSVNYTQGNTPVVPMVGSGFANNGLAFLTGSSPVSIIESQVFASPGTQAATFTSGGTDTFVSAMVALSQNSSGSGGNSVIDIVQNISAPFAQGSSNSNTANIILTGVAQNNSILVFTYGVGINTSPTSSVVSVFDGNAYTSLTGTLSILDVSASHFYVHDLSLLSNVSSGTHTIQSTMVGANQCFGFVVALEIANLASTNVVDVLANAATDIAAWSISTNPVANVNEIAIATMSMKDSSNGGAFLKPQGYTNIYLGSNGAASKTQASMDYIYPVASGVQSANWNPTFGAPALSSLIVLSSLPPASPNTDNTNITTYFSNAQNLNVYTWQTSSPPTLLSTRFFVNTNTRILIDVTNNTTDYKIMGTDNVTVNIDTCNISFVTDTTGNVFTGTVTDVNTNVTYSFSVPFVNYTLSYPVPPPPPPVTYKFNPGDYMGTSQGDFGLGSSNVTWLLEQSVLAAAGANTTGYVAAWLWNTIEDFSQTVNHNNPSNILQQYPGFQYIANCFNDLQAAVPGSHFGFYINEWVYSPSAKYNAAAVTQNWNTTQAGNKPVPSYVMNCGGNLTIPDFYGASTTSKYSGPVAPIYSGSAYYGWGFADPFASSGSGPADNFSVLLPATWNPTINQVRSQMWQALAQFSFLVTHGPLAGQTLTLDNNPLIEFLGTNAEYSYDLTGGNNITGAPSVNPPITVGGNTALAPTGGNFFRGHYQFLKDVTAAFPHTMFVVCDTFEFQSIAPVDSATNCAAYLNDNFPAANRFGNANGISAIKGVAWSGADWYGATFGTSANANAWASSLWMAGYMGIENPTEPNVNGAGPFTPSANQVGKMPAIIQVQGVHDYSTNFFNSSNTTANTANVVFGMMVAASKLQATHRLWEITDNSFQFGLNNSYPWQRYIHPTFSANTPHVTATRPSNLP